MKFTKVTVLLSGIIVVSLAAGVMFIGSNNHLMGGSHDGVLKFNAKPVAYTPEEASDQKEALNPQETSNETNNLQEQNNLSGKDAQIVKKVEIPSFEGLKGIEFVKYTVKSNDTLWKIVKANMPNYNSYPVGGVEGVVSYIGEKNNLKKDSNDSYIIYSGLKITIPKEKSALAKGANNNDNTNSVAVKNTLSVTKKTDTTNKTSKNSNNTTSSANSSSVSK